MKLSESVLPRAQMGSSGRAPLDRAVLVAWLAKQQVETPGLVPPMIVSDTLAANAAESLSGDALEEAWHEYVWAVREERDARDGRLVWADLGADLPPGVTTIEMTRRNAQAALSVLVHGSESA
jgi:hypothetical protein